MSISIKKLVQESQLQALESTKINKKWFNAVKLKTSGYKFNREEANLR